MKVNNKNFYYSDNFFRSIIKALVRTLCIYTMGCFINDKLYIKISRFN